jgi:uncharacterized protein YgiM (DUF1202 family)
MKRITTIVVLCTGLATAPVMAGQAQRGGLSDENVGGVIGATVGGLLGSQIGHGDGRAAATAVGAVGGYIVGRNVVHYNGRGYSGRRHYRSHRRYDRDDHRRPPRIERIDRTFRARTTSNVRSGPSTRFRVVDQLYDHERVHVIGKVRGRNWFFIKTGYRRGFVYAPLLRPEHHGHRDHDRWRDHDRRRDRDDHQRGGWYR